MRWPFVLLLTGAVALLGCDGSTGGDGVSSTVAATPEEIHDLCDAQCAWSARCNPADAPAVDAAAACSAHCVAELGNLGQSVRGDITRALIACHSSLPCGTSDDGCSAQALEATGGSVDATLHAPDVQSCLQKQVECRETAGAFSDDLCGTLPMLVDGKRSEVGRCLAGSCDGLLACLEPLVGG